MIRGVEQIQIPGVDRVLIGVLNEIDSNEVGR